MLAVVPIAASILAVLDDDNDAPDFEDLFQRALAFGNPEIFWSKIPLWEVGTVAKKMCDHFVPNFPEWKVPVNEADDAYRLAILLSNFGMYRQSMAFATRLVQQIEAEAREAKNIGDLQQIIARSERWLVPLRAVRLWNEGRSKYKNKETVYLGDVRPFPFFPPRTHAVKQFWDIDVPAFSSKTVGFEEEQNYVDGRKFQFDTTLNSTTLLLENPKVVEQIQLSNRLGSLQSFTPSDGNFVTVSWDDDQVLVSDRSVRDPWKTFLLRRR